MNENPSRDDPGESAETRRNFALEFATIAIGAVVALVPVVVGLFSFLDPLSRRKRLPARYGSSGRGKEGYTRVASLAALTPGGAPQRFPVIADSMDGWNILPNQAVGAIYIQRTNDADIRVFNATCPHAGCSVSCDGSAFLCPCHNSAFNLDGSKRESDAGRENPSPRAMDSLAIDQDLLADGEIWVEFKNFKTGIDSQQPKS